jgi:hypothetical protein
MVTRRLKFLSVFLVGTGVVVAMVTVSSRVFSSSRVAPPIALHGERAPVVSQAQVGPEMPSRPTSPAGLDAHLAALKAWALVDPKRADDAVEEGLAAIADLGSPKDMGPIIKKQRAFAADMHAVAERAATKSAQLPAKTATLIEKIHEARDLGLRQQLLMKFKQQLGELSASEQTLAAERLWAAIH